MIGSTNKEFRQLLKNNPSFGSHNPLLLDKNQCLIKGDF